MLILSVCLLGCLVPYKICTLLENLKPELPAHSLWCKVALWLSYIVAPE